MPRYTFQAKHYQQLRKILPALKRHGVQKFEWHPEGTIATFFGDPLRAATAAFQAGDITERQATLILKICHPNNKV